MVSIHDDNRVLHDRSRRAADPSEVGLPAEAAVRRVVERWHDARRERADDWIAAEVPVALHYNGEPHAVMMATPADLDEFALGFSLSEAIIDSIAELERVETRMLLDGIELAIAIAAPRAAAIAARTRTLVGRSGCGVCGTRHLADALRHPSAVNAAITIAVDTLHRALAALGDAQPLNALTGATHAAAWADADGRLLLVREDVGRHNALDKLIGAMARQGLDAQHGFLVLTSRASYEMVQKATTVGIGLIAAISAPTALAIHLAESTGATLVGFARAGGHVVYAHPRRIRPS